MKILVKVDPVRLRGMELVVTDEGKVAGRELEFDEAIFDDLKVDGFLPSGALEFNLYLSGVA